MWVGSSQAVGIPSARLQRQNEAGTYGHIAIRGAVADWRRQADVG